MFRRLLFVNRPARVEEDRGPGQFVGACVAARPCGRGTPRWSMPGRPGSDLPPALSVWSGQHVGLAAAVLEPFGRGPRRRPGRSVALG